MNSIQDLLTQLGDFWGAHGYQVILGGLVAAGVGLVAAFVVAHKRGRTDRWLALVCNFAVLGLSAEGMWMFAKDRLHLPAIVAAGVFFFAEALMVASAGRARRHYQATTQYATVTEDGEEKRVVVKPGHPGKHGTAVWVIAAIAGCMVATNATEWQEAPFRILLPLGAAYMWWNEMTADGTSRPVGVWRWTPRRLLVRLGAIDPAERELLEVDRERRVAAMAVTARKVHSGAWPPSWHERRLERLARGADRAMVEAVRDRVSVVTNIRTLTAPERVETIEARRDESAPGESPQVAPGETSPVAPPPAVEAGESTPRAIAARPFSVVGATSNGHRPGRVEARVHSFVPSDPQSSPELYNQETERLRQEREDEQETQSEASATQDPQLRSDIATLQAAIQAGTLTPKPNGEYAEAPIRKILAPCGSKRARAAQDAINDQAKHTA